MPATSIAAKLVKLKVYILIHIPARRKTKTISEKSTDPDQRNFLLAIPLMKER